MNFILLNNFTDWLEQNMLQCSSKKYLHIECFGCGLQRSFIALLKGNFVTSFQLYPATIPLIFLWVFAMLHLIFKLKNGAKIIVWLAFISTLTVIISYIIKILQHKIYC